MKTKKQKSVESIEASIQFRKALMKILGIYKFHRYTENKQARHIYLEYEDSSGGMSFDKLLQISELLKTRNINLGSRTSHWSYSEETYGEDCYVSLDCSLVEFKELI